MSKSKSKSADAAATDPVPVDAQLESARAAAVSLAKSIRAGIGVRYEDRGGARVAAEIVVRAPKGLSFADGSDARVFRPNSAPTQAEVWAEVGKLCILGVRLPISGEGAGDPSAQLLAHGLEVLTD